MPTQRVVIPRQLLKRNIELHQSNLDQCPKSFSQKALNRKTQSKDTARRFITIRSFSFCLSLLMKSLWIDKYFLVPDAPSRQKNTLYLIWFILCQTIISNKVLQHLQIVFHFNGITRGASPTSLSYFEYCLIFGSPSLRLDGFLKALFLRDLEQEGGASAFTEVLCSPTDSKIVKGGFLLTLTNFQKFLMIFISNCNGQNSLQNLRSL